jgi:hypothetical protein
LHLGYRDLELLINLCVVCDDWLLANSTLLALLEQVYDAILAVNGLANTMNAGFGGHFHANCAIKVSFVRLLSD